MLEIAKADTYGSQNSTRVMHSAKSGKTETETIWQTLTETVRNI